MTGSPPRTDNCSFCTQREAMNSGVLCWRKLTPSKWDGEGPEDHGASLKALSALPFRVPASRYPQAVQRAPF